MGLLSDSWVLFLPKCFRFFVALLLLCSGTARAQMQQGGGGATAVAFSLSFPRTVLKPYGWSYLRVELPSSFSTMVMTFVSDVNISKDSMEHYRKSNLPLMCFNHGSPPIPDASDDYLNKLSFNFPMNGSFGESENLTAVEQCIPFQDNMSLTLMNGQISPGTLYIGFFNGLGPARTQSKMISRGEVYTFSCYLTVEECTISTLLGPYCNQSIDSLSCSQSGIFNHERNLLDINSSDTGGSSNHQLKSAAHNLKSNLKGIQGKLEAKNSSVMMASENLVICNSNIQSSCLGHGEYKFYTLDILGIVPKFTIMATELGSNTTLSADKQEELSGIRLMCYARYNKLPLSNLYDYSADISKFPLSVNSPKIGRWFVAVQVINQTSISLSRNDLQTKLCFSYEWQVHGCIGGNAGPNCTWESHLLQRVPVKNARGPFESYYVPIDDNGCTGSDFPLEPLLSNSSVDDVSWTYFFVAIPPGAAGSIHVSLISDAKMNYEVYSRYNGIPTVDQWDYYASTTSCSNGSMFLLHDDYSGKQIGFYIWYAKEGTWCFGLRHGPDSHGKYKTTMSISLEGCPEDCSSNGQCDYTLDQSGSAFIGYCSCDRDHGGIDCSDELVSREGHIWQSVFLIVSNGAAILPAFLALRKKALSEWVLFTSSGVSSALYHACDVGTWCVLKFKVLQFMDFWLSFMAVVSTFVFMAVIDEVSKRAIHTCVAILTALLAANGATRSENIAIVIAIGSLALVIAWILEFATGNRSVFTMHICDQNMWERWEGIKSWFFSFLRTFQKRFHWGYILLGFIALAAAAVSWKLETSESYWIWHSLWHITIYTSSFFFLCSPSMKSSNENEEPAYELTRQNSSRIE